MAKLIEEREMQPPTDTESPLNGLEVRAYLCLKFKQWLDGRHDLFNIAKVYDESTCHISLALVVADEQPVTDAIDVHFESPAEARALLTGTPIAKAAAADADVEIKPAGTTPVRVHRGYTGSKVDNPVSGDATSE